MKIAVVHGYFLNGTGSNLYVQNLCRQFCSLGHDVLLFCQEKQPGKYDFIESAYRFDHDNQHRVPIYTAKTPYPGKCSLYIPNIGAILPVYVWDKYEGFDAREITGLNQSELESYISRNQKALQTVFAQEQPDLVISNHSVMQPVYVKRALGDNCSTINLAVVHGSCLNFSVKKSALALHYAIEGLTAADGIVFLSDYASKEFTDYFQDKATFTAQKILIPAGVDIERFIPLQNSAAKSERIGQLLQKIQSLPPADTEPSGESDFISLFLDTPVERLPELKDRFLQRGDAKTIDADIPKKLLDIDWEKESILLYYGKYLWTKGIHTLILSFPFVLRAHPHTKLILVGFGTSRSYLEALVAALDVGDKERLRYLVTYPQHFQTHLEPGTQKYCQWALDLLADDARADDLLAFCKGRIKDRVIFTGFMDHDLLKDLIPCADIAVAPSIFAEAFGLVGVEALACGVFPLQPYHSGFKYVVDSYRELFELHSQLKALNKLYLNEDLIPNLSFAINTLLKAYGTDPALPDKVKKTARKICTDHYSWASVAQNFVEAASDVRAKN